MARQDLSAHDRQERDRMNYYDIQSALYIHPGGYTNDTRLMVDASPRYIAVPPVPGTYGPTVSSMNPLRSPSQVMLFRGDDYWLRMDTSPDTQYAGWMPGNLQAVLNLNPGVKTLGFVSTVNTGYLRANWAWGN